MAKIKSEEIRKLSVLIIGEEKTVAHVEPQIDEILNADDIIYTFIQCINELGGIASVDWKADDGEFSWSADSVLGFVDIDFDELGLNFDCDEGDGVAEWMDYTAGAIMDKGYTIIGIDTNSDQYAFTAIKKENASEFTSLYNKLSRADGGETSVYEADPKILLSDEEDDDDDDDTEDTISADGKQIFKGYCDSATSTNVICLGSYPQTVVTDEKIIQDLDKLSGKKTDGTYELDGNRYEKAIVNLGASTIRNTFYTAMYDCGEIAINNTPAYFKYEPLKWFVLESKTKHHRLLCVNAINQCEGDISAKKRKVECPDKYNYYTHGELRKRLNGEFYDMAFTDKEKELILTMKVDNSPKTTSVYAFGKEFLYDNTEDKVQALSYKESKKADWGFSSHEYSYSTLRSAHATDFALVHGITKSTKSNCCATLLRSPHTYNSSDGQFVARGEIDSTSMGMRPVVCINAKVAELIIK